MEPYGLDKSISVQPHQWLPFLCDPAVGSGRCGCSVSASGLGRLLLPFPSNPGPRLLGVCSVCLPPIANPFVSRDKLTTGIADNSQRLIPPQFLNSDPFDNGAGQASAWVYSHPLLPSLSLLPPSTCFSPSAWSQFFCELVFLNFT